MAVPLRILLVDDDAVLVELLAETLVMMGHHVCAIAWTEDAAIAAAQEHMPDLMIVDVNLGAGSGVFAVAAITRLRAVPHVFISGGMLAWRENGDGFLRKPFRAPELAQAIERAMRPAAAAEA